MFIAKNFSSLEDIRLTMATDRFDDGLKKLVAMNKRLERVRIGLHITCHGTSEDPENDGFELGKNEVKIIRNTVKTLSKCKKLRELFLISHNVEHELSYFYVNLPMKKTSQGCAI